MRVRHKLPTFLADKWDGHEPQVPGVEKDSKGHFVRTAHRLLVRLQPGMWVVHDGHGRHEKPCSQEEFDRCYERM